MLLPVFSETHAFDLFYDNESPSNRRYVMTSSVSPHRRRIVPSSFILSHATSTIRYHNPDTLVVSCLIDHGRGSFQPLPRDALYCHVEISFVLTNNTHTEVFLKPINRASLPSSLWASEWSTLTRKRFRLSLSGRLYAPLHTGKATRVRISAPPHK